MSAADLSLVGAAAYTARTKRARLRVHGGEEEEERTGRFIGRTQLARETIRWTDDAPRVFTSFTREGSWKERESSSVATSPHAPGKMPRFEQIGNLYRCRDAEMAKEGDDGGSGSLRILARPFLGSIFWEYIYIFFYVLWILTRSLWRYERRDRTKLGIVSLLVDTDSNALRTELNQPLESFN